MQSELQHRPFRLATASIVLLSASLFAAAACLAAPAGDTVKSASASGGKAASGATPVSSSGSAKSSSTVSPNKAVPAKSEKLVDGYVIRQNSQVGGRFDVTTYPQAVKILSHAGIEYVFRPKENVAVLCNTTSRVYWSGSIANWKPPMQKASYFRRATYGELKLEKSESASFMNVSANKKTFKTKKVFQPKARLDPDEKAELISAEITTSSALADDLKPLAEVLSLVYAVPVSEGLPLQSIYTNRKGTTRYDLQTLELTKAKVAPSAFDIPPGYKRMNKIEDAYSGSADSVKQMLEELGESHSL